VKCNHCEKTFHGGAKRLRGHILCDPKSGVSACTRPPAAVVAEMAALERKAGKKQTCSQATLAQGALFSQPSAGSPASGSGSGSGSGSRSGRSRPLSQRSVASMFRSAELDVVNAAVARLFYACGIPFNVARSPFFADAVSAIAAYGCGNRGEFRAPGYNLLRTSLLDAEVRSVQKECAQLRRDLKYFGCTIVCDGCTNVQNKPLLNVLIVSPVGTEFLKCIDTSGEYKSGWFIKEVMADCINEVGAENIVQISMDNAANCVLAGRLLTEEFKHLTFTPCTAHSLDLVLESIGELPWVKEYILTGKAIAQFITRHHTPQAVFASHSDLSIVKPGETRFGTQFLMLHRLLEVKVALRQCLVDPRWSAYVASGSHQTTQNTLWAAIMSDGWWEGLENLLSALSPIFYLLRLVDGNVPCAGKVYYHVFDCIGKLERVNGLPADVQASMISFVKQRWNKMHSDFHGAGYVLDPEYREHEWFTNDEVM
jgi:Protein of unknown function (DUF 659)